MNQLSRATALQEQEPAKTSSKAMFESQKPSTNEPKENDPMTDNNADPLFRAEDIISVYSRAQAIADGELVDVSETAREAGFSIPVALTRAVWADCVEWTEDDDGDDIGEATHQDEPGRLWDVVWMARLAARANSQTSRCLFSLYRVPREGRDIRPRLVTLAMQIGQGDQGEPVITIMQPNED